MLVCSAEAIKLHIIDWLRSETSFCLYENVNLKKIIFQDIF